MTVDSYKGTNKICAKCRGECKQSENVIIVYCPLFRETDENKKMRLFKKASEYGRRHQK